MDQRHKPSPRFAERPKEIMATTPLDIRPPRDHANTVITGELRLKLKKIPEGKSGNVKNLYANDPDARRAGSPRWNVKGGVVSGGRTQFTTIARAYVGSRG